MAFFLISSVVLGLLDQRQIFWQLNLIELLWLLTGLGLVELWYLIYPRLLTGIDMLLFFTSVSLMDIQVRYLVLFCLFSVIDNSRWFLMWSLHKNIQLKLEFVKAVIGPTLYLQYINNLLDDAICNTAIHADNTTL